MKCQVSSRTAPQFVSTTDAGPTMVAFFFFVRQSLQFLPSPCRRHTLHAACSPRHAFAHNQIPPVSHHSTMVSYATVALAVMCLTPSSGFMSMVASIPKPATATSTPAVSAPQVFTKDFAKPMQMPEESIAAVAEVMRSGRLNRYSAASAETSQVSQLEEELVAFCNAGSGDGIRFALGVNSCSSAILIALLGVGVQPGDEVLSNAFTFTAVPSAILRTGAKPVLVECKDRLAAFLHV